MMLNNKYLLSTKFKAVIKTAVGFSDLTQECGIKAWDYEQ